MLELRLRFVCNLFVLCAPTRTRIRRIRLINADSFREIRVNPPYPFYQRASCLLYWPKPLFF